MPYIASKRFNWLPSRSAWNEAEAWRIKQRYHQGQADATINQASDIIGIASISLGSGLSEIAAQKAASRIAAELQAKIKARVDKRA